MAVLTPAQAALLVADVIGQLEQARSRGGYPARIRDDAVTVSGGGRLEIECAVGTASWPDASDAAARLLRRIATNSRDETLVARVDESIRDATDFAGLAQRVRRAVTAGPDPVDEPRCRRAIAGLVSAAQGHLPSRVPVAVDQANVPVPERSLAPHGWYPAVRNPWHRRRRRPSRRRAVLGLVVVLVVLGALWAAPGAWSELRRGWDTLLHPANPSEETQLSPVSPPPPAPEAENAPTGPGPVDTGLPGGAGPITGVTAAFANGPCAAAQPCTVRVDVDLDPTANVGAVTWNVTVYDRCSGSVVPGGDVTVHVPAGGRQVYGISTVSAPPGAALAAVTSAPAAAASEPLYVPAENASC